MTVRIMSARQAPPLPDAEFFAPKGKPYASMRVSVGGIRVNVRYRYQPGGKRPVVFLPGFGCSQVDFAPAFDHHSLTGRALLTFDFPGQAGAPSPEGFSYSMESLAKLTHAVVKRLRLENVAVVGHSMGGVVATMFARSHPEAVSTLVNVEGGVVGSAFAFRPSAARHAQQLNYMSPLAYVGYGE
ncbi:MAG: alpha/beta hydrolase, partial [Candidatus Micrarchaeota archaeon]